MAGTSIVPNRRNPWVWVLGGIVLLLFLLGLLGIFSHKDNATGQQNRIGQLQLHGDADRNAFRESTGPANDRRPRS